MPLDQLCLDAEIAVREGSKHLILSDKQIDEKKAPIPMILAIGAINNDGNGSGAGHVRIYSWNGTSWNQLGNDIDGEAANDQSGWSVSLNLSLIHI